MYKSKEKLVSIIMATYNGENFLEMQLETLVQQTYPDLEIIIVDDNSTDKTRDILNKFAAHYKNIHLFFNDANLGYIKNFEKGCRLASGNYISFCDQDDVWALDKTELLMQALGNATMIYCDDELVDENLNSLSKKHSDLKRLSDFNNCLYFATDNCVGGHNLIMKKDLLKYVLPFPAEMPYDLWCAFVATFYGGIKYLNNPLIKWRQHDKNISTAHRNKEEKIIETRKRLEIFYKTCPVEFAEEKKVLKQLYESYDYSIKNDFLRMNLFFKYKKYLLGMKNRNAFRKFLFCLKMFYKLRLHVA